MSAALRCPAGTCTHVEIYDATHVTADPAIPAAGDVAHDHLVEHLMNVHEVPESEVGLLVSHARRAEESR